MKHNLTSFVAAGCLLLAVSGYAAAADDPYMGNWEGQWMDDAFASGSLSAQVIAEGKGDYRAVILADIGEAVPVRGEARGKKDGEKVVFKGTIDTGADYGGVHEITGAISEEKFSGRYAGENRGRFEMKKVQKGSPTLGAKPPEGAIVLFDGKDYSKWEGDNQKPNPWKPVGDAMEVRGGNIRTKEQFRDFKLHIEFCTPFMPEARGQGRGNSGVYLPGNNEIQVLDSFGLPPSQHDCGGLYGQADPRANACLPPGEWQTYDVTFIASRFDDSDRLLKSATITVLHNGVKIHDEFQPRRQAKSGGILLQDHGNPVQYRNIWLVPLKAD